MLALAHQPAIRVAQVALLFGARPVIGRLRVLAFGPPLTRLARRHLGLVISPLRLGARLGLGLQTPTGRIQLVAQSLPARDLLRQGLGILLATAVHGLRSRHQLRDLQLQLIDQLTGAIISHRAVLRAIGIKLRPVNADNPDLHQLQLLGQKQNLQETLANRREVLAPKGRNRIMVGMAVGGHQAHPDIAVRRALDPRLEKIPLA